MSLVRHHLLGVSRRTAQTRNVASGTRPGGVCGVPRVSWRLAPQSCVAMSWSSARYRKHAATCGCVTRAVLHSLLRQESMRRPVDGIPDMWRETSLFGCAQHPSRPLAACACSDGVVHIVGLGDGAVSAVQSINVAADMRRAVMCRGAAWRRDGSQLAVATSDGALVVYDSATWRPRSRIGVPGGVLAPLWSPTVRCCARTRSACVA